MPNKWEQFSGLPFDTKGVMYSEATNDLHSLDKIVTSHNNDIDYAKGNPNICYYPRFYPDNAQHRIIGWVNSQEVNDRREDRS